MENLAIKKNFWKGKKVLVTGHTGFKGAWLSLVLNFFGSKVYGISLKPDSNKNLFNFIKSKVFKKSFIFDLNQKKKFQTFYKKHQPDIIFHLASQALVQNSFNKPFFTFYNNFNITLNILEVLRKENFKGIILISTTDKVYKVNDNKIKKNIFKETSELGANDPYSTSKSCVELLIESYKKNFFRNKKQILVARAGNVIGGGDWSEDRLIPDIFRSIIKKKISVIRNPKSTRPWQHVLDVTFGYMKFVEKVRKPSFQIDILNFGPKTEGLRVLQIFKFVKSKFPKIKYIIKSNKKDKLETRRLALNVSKMKNDLKFNNKYSVKKSIEETIQWYEGFIKNKNPYDLSIEQLKRYLNK